MLGTVLNGGSLKSMRYSVFSMDHSLIFGGYGRMGGLRREER
jgi:hypothetical protein